MKKGVLLPLFAVMALVSQAWGAYASCATDLGNTYYCQWPTGCYEINKGATDSNNCQTEFDGCKANGYLYTGVTNPGDDEKCNGTWAGVGNDPTFNGGVAIWCKWATSCQPIKTDSILTICKTNGSVFSGVPAGGVGEGKTCTGGTWTGEGKNPNATQLGCCDWENKNQCSPIMSDADSATIKVANCQTGSNRFWSGSVTCNYPTCPTTPPTYPSTTPSSSSGGSPSSSSNGTDPIIISHNNAPVTGLNVVHFAHSLQIASGKDATVALFDMHGKKVLSQRVLSGTTTISLQKQRQGVYYAVVKSGSQKQTVKIVLK